MNAAELHKNVPPDWYYRSIRRNLLQCWWHTSRFRQVRRVIEPVDGEILDIGCADGVFTNVILNKSGAKEIVGVDVLKTSISWAKKHWKGNKRMKFIVGDIHKLPFKANKFGAVFALEVLEHVFDPEKALREIKRVMKKGGYGVFLVPSDSKLFLLVWWFFRTFWFAKIWNDTHIQSFNHSGLPQLSKKVGFIVEVDKKFWLGMLHLVKVRKK